MSEIETGVGAQIVQQVCDLVRLWGNASSNEKRKAIKKEINSLLEKFEKQQDK